MIAVNQKNPLALLWEKVCQGILFFKIILLRSQFQYMTCEFAGAEEIYAHGHEILSAIYAVVASKVASVAGHHVDFTHTVAGIGVKSLK
jgi:hypothetical protein